MTHRKLSNGNLYGFSEATTDGDPVTVAGGGISFIIPNQNNGHNNNHPQLGSISSVSSSSGISSRSSTITKDSAGFNRNTFTRAKPKERKPLPTMYFNGHGQRKAASSSSGESSSSASSPGDVQEEDVVEATAGKKGATGKWLLIPTVTLSPDTPPSASHSNSSSSSADVFYFSGSSSSSGTVLKNNGSSDSEKTLVNGGIAHGREKRRVSKNVSLFSTDSSINFQPDACSTFILQDGEEFPEEIGGGDSETIDSSGGSSSSHIRRRSQHRHKNSIGGGGDGGGSNGKMKVEQEERLAGASSSGVVGGAVAAASAHFDGQNNNSSSSPNGSSSGIQSDFSGEEENFECFGEGGESFTLETGSGDTSLQFTRDGTDLDLTGSGIGGASTPLSRNNWTRTSLRKSLQNTSSNAAEAMGYRRWGSFRNAPGTKRAPPVVTSSNALANQLYRSSSFHSSGRSSAGDAEEMYSDGSLEDEVIFLTHKVHHLEEKMNVLAENQTDADDRYTREKEKNAELSTKVFMLEESLRETELRGDEKLREEQRRFKEFQNRWDREKQLQSENYEIRLQSMEKDLQQAKSESTRMKNQLDRERSEKDMYSDKCLEYERELGFLRDENRSLQEQGRRDRESMALESAGAQQALLELKREVENVRQFQIKNSPNSLRRQEESILEEVESHELKSRLIEYEKEVKKLKKLNEQLQEANDELNAQLLNRGLEEGRTLLTTINSVPAGDSLAAEFEAMSQDQNSLRLYAQSETDLAKVKKSLKEQVDVNEQLRAYIDGILLIIV